MIPIPPRLIDSAKKAAGYRIGLAVAKRFSPKTVQNLQRLGGLYDFADSLLSTPAEERATPLLGGMSPKQVLESNRLLHSANPSRKNLWYIRIEDLNPPDMGAGAYAAISPEGMFDMLAQDVSFGPCTLTGEGVVVGSAVMDKLTGTEKVEVSITTLDDEYGTLKRWFEAKSAQAANPDGTFGLPRDYCINMEVTHAIASDTVPGAQNAYRSFFTLRPGTLSIELSRRDQALQELQMTFSQFDTFMGKL